MQEKRKFHRVPFQCQTQVKCGNRTYSGELLDISMKGALLLVRD
ncbi:MAG: PilZ domain-containing protein, partial [Desulfuromonas sp.]